MGLIIVSYLFNHVVKYDYNLLILRLLLLIINAMILILIFDFLDFWIFIFCMNNDFTIISGCKIIVPKLSLFGNAFYPSLLLSIKIKILANKLKHKSLIKYTKLFTKNLPNELLRQL
jgi:hypothetical protein